MSLPLCKYGEKCYRKNPEHLKQFHHPHLDDSPSTSNTQKNLSKDETRSPPAKRPRNSAKNVEKMIESAGDVPLFLSTVEGVDEKFNENCLSLRDILFQRDLFGKLVRSIHFNFMVELDWLLVQYPYVDRWKPMDIVVGVQQGTSAHELRTDAAKLGVKENVKIFGAVLPVPFGTHHTKMSILHYEHGIRIIISTANLIYRDWSQKTQELFVTPILPLSRENATDEQPFREDLLRYLKAYNLSDHLKTWIELIEKVDCGQLKCRLVASVPGYHKDTALAEWGHLRLRKLLKRNSADKETSEGTARTLICQASSIGSLGPNAQKWLIEQLGRSMAPVAGPVPQIKLIFPSAVDVRTSLEGYAGGGSLPYRKSSDAKQRWLRDYMHRWKSDSKGRTRALPHVKSYTCITCAEEGCAEADWALVTSANMSKAAWGEQQKDNTQLFCRSYELGVLFFARTKEERRRLAAALPYDVPSLRKYRKANVDSCLPKYSDPKVNTSISGQDVPWLADEKYTVPDIFGHVCNV